MKSSLNFAIIGCGVIGPVHARSLSELPGAKLVAVCDIVEEKAHKLAETYPAEVYADYHAMLQRTDIDVVIVSTPSGMHAEIGIAAARSGKHVIVEKPIDVTLEKADALITACQVAGVKLSTISQHRFDAAVVALKKAIAENQLGQLNFGGAYTQWYRAQEYYDSGDWRGTLALDGGGALINQSIHYVDLVQYLMGPVEEIAAYTATRAHERIEVEDLAIATLKFKSGALGVLEGMTCAYPGFCARLEIYGSDGGVVIENDQVRDWQLRSGEKYAPPQETGPVIVGTSSVDIWYLGHRRQLEEALNALREDRQPLVTGEDGRRALEIVLGVYAAASTGKPVTLRTAKDL